MAFNSKNWWRWSVSYNSFFPDAWVYTGIKNGELDTLAVIKVDGFFDAVINYIKIGDLIYLQGEAVAPSLVATEYVVVTGLNPVTVKSLTGRSSSRVVVLSIESTMNPTGKVQVISLLGLLSTDFLIAIASVNPSGIVIESMLAETDQFTLTFDRNPGAGMQIQTMAYRDTF